VTKQPTYSCNSAEPSVDPGDTLGAAPLVVPTYEQDDEPLTPEQLAHIRALAAVEIRPTGKIVRTLLDPYRHD
jgi:hypothetical protein